MLPEITHHNQSAYVQGRLILAASRTRDDIMSFTALKNVNSLLVAIDFALKAFDSVKWKFRRQTLESFNFGPSLIAWIITFYSDI